MERAGRSLLGILIAALLCARAVATEPRVLQDCDDCASLVVIPAGKFLMGSEDGEKTRPEGPVHAVRIVRAFALGRYEVTVREFRRFVTETGHRVDPGCRVQGPQGAWRDDPEAGWLAPRFSQPQPEDSPVVCVGRVDALAYVAWLARRTGKPYRLPSEAEWEYAAAAGTRTAFGWGNNPDRGCEHGNLYDRAGRKASDFGWGFVDCDDGYAEIAPVGRFLPNAFGLYDMHGNVWEWTQDCYRVTYERTPRDGSAEPAAADCANWSVRGGGWMTRPSRQRLTFRGRDPNDARYSYFGFRVARDLTYGERLR